MRFFLGGIVRQLEAMRLAAQNKSQAEAELEAKNAGGKELEGEVGGVFGFFLSLSCIIGCEDKLVTGLHAYKQIH